MADYKKQIADILDGEWKRGQLKFGSVELENADEAKLHMKKIRQQQKALRLVKKQINQDLKDIRQSYRERAGKTKPSFFVSALAGKGKAKSHAADQKRRLNKQRDRETGPLEDLKLVVDNAILQLDNMKMQLERYIAEEKK